MANAFNKEDLAKYYDDYEPCRCGKQATDWHHAKKRALPFTDSLLNATPICRQCHNKHSALLRNYEVEIKRNAERLHTEGYKLNQNDINFLKEYKLLKLIKEIL